MKKYIFNKNIYAPLIYHLIDCSNDKEIITVCEKTIKDFNRFKIVGKKPSYFKMCTKCLNKLIDRYYTI
jgi:hypothetical protein